DCPRRSRLFARIAILHAWLDRSRNRTIRSLQAGLQLLRKAIHHRGFKQVGVISWDPSDLAPAGCQLAPYQSGINRRTEPAEFVRVFSDEDNRFSRVTLQLLVISINDHPEFDKSILDFRGQLWKRSSGQPRRDAPNVNRKSLQEGLGSSGNPFGDTF